MTNTLHRLLQHHVTGAIERGEAQPIVEIPAIISAAPDLLAICEEIASDSRCDLVNSERRIRLYSAIRKAKGETL
jgi:hypothetical protein